MCGRSRVTQLCGLPAQASRLPALRAAPKPGVPRQPVRSASSCEDECAGGHRPLETGGEASSRLCGGPGRKMEGLGTVLPPARPACELSPRPSGR